MKKVILSLLLLSGMIYVQAQSGSVVYEEVVKFEIKLEGESAQFAHMLPKENKSNKLLVFNENASLYTAVKEEEKPEDVEQLSGCSGMVIKMDQPDEKYFYDIAQDKSVEQREFMSRKFLITGATDTIEWKLTGEQRKILDYTCLEATTTLKESKIKAWFAPSIPISTGPGKYHGLPGLILALDIDDGDRTLTAISVKTEPIDAKLLVKPKEGKKVTRAEYNKIVDEKMKEQGAEGGHGGTFMIKITK